MIYQSILLAVCTQPLRVLAAYATAVKFLQHKRYIGDIPNKISPNGRGRVFANDELSEIVACVYAGSWAQDEFSGEMQPETPPGELMQSFMSQMNHAHVVLHGSGRFQVQCGRGPCRLQEPLAPTVDQFLIIVGRALAASGATTTSSAT